MALITPDIEGYKKWVASTFYRYRHELADLNTEWVVFQDSDGDPVAVVPQLHLEFKKGSDVIKDLMADKDTTPAGEVYVDGEYVYGPSVS